MSGEVLTTMALKIKEGKRMAREAYEKRDMKGDDDMARKKKKEKKGKKPKKDMKPKGKEK